MKNNYKLLIICIATTLLSAGCTAKTPPQTETKDMGTMVMPDGSTMLSKDMPNQNNAGSSPTNLGPPPEQQQNETAPISQAGAYADYSQEAVTAAHKNGRKVVLFFYADWCPFCVEADKQFKAKLDQIPQGVTVLKTNYDTESALKKKYIITYQHTFVQIDANGNLVSKWAGGDVENLKKYLK